MKALVVSKFSEPWFLKLNCSEDSHRAILISLGTDSLEGEAQHSLPSCLTGLGFSMCVVGLWKINE